MQKVRVVQNSFQFGEVSDSVIMRTDSPVYGASAQTVQNLIVTSEGAVKKRYGLKNIENRQISYQSSYRDQSHLFPFLFDNNEEYLLSIEHSAIKIWRLLSDGRLDSIQYITQDINGNSLPFNQSYLKEYTSAQYGDVMFICHPLYAPRTIVRTSLTSFEVDTYSFDQRADSKETYQPYTKFQAVGVHLDPSATTGSSITVQVYANTGIADDDGISASHSNSSSPFDFTIDGALSSSGSVTLTTATQVSFTSASNNSSATFTITGTNQDGVSITEDVTGPNNSTVESTKFFKTITGITSDVSFTSVKAGVTKKQAVKYFDITGSKTGNDYLSSEHVGVTLRYGKSEMDIVSVQSSCDATVDIVDELKRRLTVLNPLRTIDGSSTVEVTMLDHGFAGGESITIEDAAATGGINTGNLNGARTVISIVDENTFTFTAGGSASSSEDGGGYVKIVTHAPVTEWDEQSWSAVRGYPAAVAFHENRLCFAGTLAEPDTIWMSQIGSFFNFDVGEAADTDSINLVAATGNVHEIRYLISNRDLQVFSTTGELYVPTFQNQAITPTNAQIRLQTPYGTEHVQPVSIDGATIFVQKGGSVVREFLFTDAEDAYTAAPVSTLAPHLINDPQYLAVSHGAFSLSDTYAALVLGNGDMALFSSNRAEKRAAWTNVTFDGRFSSVAAIHDRLFVMVYFKDKLTLCEFTDDVFIDNWMSSDYDPTTYTSFTVTGVWTSGSTTAKLRFNMSHTFSDLDDIYFKGFVNNSIFTAAGIDLEDINGARVVNDTDSTYVEILYSLSSASGSSATLTITPDGSPEIIEDGIIDFASIYSGLDEITLDVIYTENSLEKHEAITVPSRSSNSDNVIVMLDLGTSGPDLNSEVYVGVKFDSKLVTNPVDASLGNGPATGEVRGITNVVLDVKSTKSMKVNNRVALSSNFTGKKEVRLLGYSRNPQVTVEQDNPFSMQINGIVAELIV